MKEETEKKLIELLKNEGFSIEKTTKIVNLISRQFFVRCKYPAKRKKKQYKVFFKRKEDMRKSYGSKTEIVLAYSGSEATEIIENNYPGYKVTSYRVL